jgi:hypothetical protein
VQPIIFKLNGISQVDFPALQRALRAVNLLQPEFMQQRPRCIGGLLAPKVPVNLPWDAIGMPGLIDMSVAQQTPKPRVVHELLPRPPTDFTISGITKDSTGAVLASCTVHLFRTSDDVLIKQITSGADGSYSFGNLGGGGLGGLSSYYVVAYKAGSPDTAGTTVNTLTGA